MADQMADQFNDFTFPNSIELNIAGIVLKYEFEEG